MIIKTVPPSKNMRKLDIFVRRYLIVAILRLIRGACAILNGK